MRISDWSSDVCSSDLGIVGNDWKHSCGAFIRSEIWACIAPGLPDVAVRYAIEDAIVDHGDGEGTWGEVFFAAAESAARSEERRVGKEWVGTCRSRWEADH